MEEDKIALENVMALCKSAFYQEVLWCYLEAINAVSSNKPALTGLTTLFSNKSEDEVQQKISDFCYRLCFKLNFDIEGISIAEALAIVKKWRKPIRYIIKDL